MTLRQHIAYIKYITRHKWFVFKAGFIVDSSAWLGIIHDLSKFRPDEWIAYGHFFYNEDGTKKEKREAYEHRAFDHAWRKHIHRNPHHWQHWLLHEDNGQLIAHEMPEKYVREMIADWIGAGMAISGRTDPRPWYEENQFKMKLHPHTRKLVEGLLSSL